MEERGWTTSESDQLAIKFMDWIDTYHASGRIPTSVTFYSGEPTPEQREALRTAIQDLRSRNLISDTDDVLAGPLNAEAMLTARGTQLVRNRQDRRNSRRAQSVSARDALLDWLYENADERGESPEFDQFEGDIRAHFEGVPLGSSEIIRAAGFLHETGFVKGVGVMSEWPVVRPMLTAKGMAAVESERYTAEPDASRVGSLSTSSGDGNYREVARGHGAQDNRDQLLDPEKLLELVTHLRDALAELPERDQGTGEAFLYLIETEARSDDPNSNVIFAALRGLRSLADKVTSAVVGVGVGALIAYAKSRYQLPELGSGK